MNGPREPRPAPPGGDTAQLPGPDLDRSGSARVREMPRETEAGTGAPPVPAQRAADSEPVASDRAEHHSGRRPGSAPRRTGAPTAIVLVLAALWVATVPYFGPYLGFGYDASPLVDNPVLTPDRLWLTAIPALAILVGGLILGASRSRGTLVAGALSALAGGAWLVVGPVISQLWGAPGPGREIGEPLGGVALRVTEQLVVFYGLGALVVMLASFTLGRLVRLPTADRGEPK